MEIIGYSERGAMNALFYGMALNGKGDSQMVEFLRLAAIECPESFSDFEVYNEFSLSEFGSPDLVIIAKKGSEKVAFFVEAKVAACDGFKIESALNEYDRVNPDTSNLFYQLKQKADFFEIKDELPSRNDLIESDKGKKSIGNNPVVRKFVDKIKNCSRAEYIAIIPDVSAEGELWKNSQPIKELPFKLHLIYWERLYNKFHKELGLLKETIEFNQGRDPKIKSEERIKSQILNKPLPQPEHEH